MPSSEVMHKWKSGQLHSGSKTGPLVKGQKQAVAIMLSEKRNEAEHGGKYVHKHERGGAVDSKLMNKGGPIKRYADGGSVDKKGGKKEYYPGEFLQKATIPGSAGPMNPIAKITTPEGRRASKNVEYESGPNVLSEPQDYSAKDFKRGGSAYNKGGDVKPRHNSGSKKHG